MSQSENRFPQIVLREEEWEDPEVQDRKSIVDS